MGRTVAMLAGPCSVLRRIRSSWKTTSMIQWRRFSTPQCAVTARANKAALSGAEARKHRRARAVWPLRSTSASTMPLGQIGEAGFAREVAVGGEPGEVPRDLMAPHPDAGMVPVGGLMGVKGAGRRGVEEEADLLRRCRPIVLECEQVVGSCGPDRAGDVALAADGIDGDKRASEFEPIEQKRDGGDLVALGGDRFLTKHDPLARRPGRDQMQRMSVAPMRTPGRLAVDGDNVGLALAQALHPGRAAQDVKQAEKVAAGRAFITSISVSCEGMPRANGSRRLRNVSLRVPQSSISTKFCALPAFRTARSAAVQATDR